MAGHNVDSVTVPPTLAFDVYGTLVDPVGISTRLQTFLPLEEAVVVAEAWRRKQLEITFRLTVMGTYHDFDWCTRRSLEHALAQAGRKLGPAATSEVLAAYAHLDVYPDVVPGLELLREQGHALVVLSNGSPAMLEGLLDNTRLGGYFDRCFSADEVRAYKPAPQVYLHAARELGRPPGEVLLVSSNPFDDIGAEAAGLRAAWVDRTHGIFEADGVVPHLHVETLAELADTLRER